MMPAQLACPSCAAPVGFQSSVSLLAVCSYCRSLVMRTDLKLDDLGKVAQLQADGSPLQLGARGEYRGARFLAVGRLQLRHDQGFWNEWHLLFDDARQGWLGEAQGIYAVSFPAQAPVPLPPFDGLALGSELALVGARYRVRDKRWAEYVSAEGELPFRPPLGERCASADLAGPGGRFATIDYSEEPPLLFLGEHVEFDALRLDGLKAFDGW